MESILHVSDLSKTIAGKQLFEHVSFEIFDEDCIGLLGPNGCGKTTLFNILLGRERPSSGDFQPQPRLRIRCLEQVPVHPTDKTVHDYFTRVTQTDAIQQQITTMEQQLADPSSYKSPRYHELLEQLRKLKITMNKASGTAQFEAAQRSFKDLNLDHLTLSSSLEPLSGGERQKLALASVFAQAQSTDLLLLDEPTNHLDIETIVWLEEQVADFPNAVIIISHDHYLLDDLVDRVFEFQGTHLEIYEATYEEYEEQKHIRQHIQQQQFQKAAIEMKRQQAIIKELTRKNRYSKQLTSRLKRLEKLKPPENPILKNYLLRFHFNTLMKSGKNIADGTNLSKHYDKKIILQQASFEILAEQKIGLIGPNGCGKTTFLKLLMQQEPLDQGTIHLSQGVRYGYFDQGHLSLDLHNNLLEETCRNHPDLEENDAKALLGQMNFKGTMITNTVEQLSGGERARLALLRLLMEPYNLLLLDEPTNHMDFISKHAVETALISYKGTVVIVSHDRKLLDTVCDTIFYMNNGTITMYTGNYSMFCQQRQQELSDKTGKDLAYLSRAGLTRYIVTKCFTVWSLKKKHSIGEELYIGDHNKSFYEWAINAGFLKEKTK